jgi:NADPH-dependent curcumin reductase CurA
MSDAPGYLPPVAIGAVMRGGTLGIVEESQVDDFPVGTQVAGSLGWQSHALTTPRNVTRLPELPGFPLNGHFGLLGHIGLTAYLGVTDIGKLQPGETLVVSAAAGAVGSLAGQIGKLQGARVVGIAGGAEKCRWLTEDLGFDAAVDYKAGGLFKNLRAACPSGIDVYFDNVGGATLDAALSLINLRGRIAVCGLISQYNNTAPAPGPANLGMLIVRRARMEGFLVLDYMPRAAEAETALLGWYQAGRLKFRVDEVEGLERAPVALNRLFEGKNVGKLVVKI